MEHRYRIASLYTAQDTTAASRQRSRDATLQFGGGRSSPEEQDNADRLRSIREAAGEVEGTYFYLDDESGRLSASNTWPNILASLTICWLEAGRPADAAAVLLRPITEVRDRCWCTIDLGPPEVVTLDRGPDNLACALLEILDDMDLLASAFGLAPE
jgi:hypothetical protein